MNVVTSVGSKIYHIADLFDMSILRNSNGDLDGDTSCDFMIGDAAVHVKFSVVSSLLTDKDAVVLMKGLGNLALLMVPLDTQHQVALYVIDIAKMKAKPDNYIEDRSFKSAAEVVSDLIPAITRWYLRKNQDWKQQTL